MITLVHLKKPVQKGLAGMVRSKLFPNDIPLVIDTRPINEWDYSFMCLSHALGSEQTSIWMEREFFLGIKRGEPMARTSLFHELGHNYHKHFRQSIEAMEAYDEARKKCVINGQVIQDELDADQFAVDYLGRDYVVRGLSALKDELTSRIENTDYEENEISLKELELRIIKLERETQP